MKSERLQQLHYVMVYFYYPASYVDTKLFGGPYWAYLPFRFSE